MDRVREKIPRRVSLVAQTENILLEGIAHRRWTRRLPAERTLMEELQIGRSTLRAALVLLAKRKAVRPRHGRGWDITLRAGGSSRPVRLHKVGYLTQGPLYLSDPFSMQWMTDFAARLRRVGWEMEIMIRPRCFGEHCSAQLAELVASSPDTLWLPVYSTPSMQAWFQAHSVPVLVAGSLHQNIRLPSIDVNLRSLGRHAAGMMFARGHRRVALLASRLGRAGVPAGYLEIERGIRECFAASPALDNRLFVTYHDGGPVDICRSLDRLFRSALPPTGAIMIDASTLLTSLTYLAQQNQAVPRDLSIIACYDEPYFAQIVPELTHYLWEPTRFSRHLFRLVRNAAQGLLTPSTCVRLMPRFLPGQTLAAIEGAPGGVN